MCVALMGAGHHSQSPKRSREEQYVVYDGCVMWRVTERIS